MNGPAYWKHGLIAICLCALAGCAELKNEPTGQAGATGAADVPAAPPVAEAEQPAVAEPAEEAATPELDERSTGPEQADAASEPESDAPVSTAEESAPEALEPADLAVEAAPVLPEVAPDAPAPAIASTEQLDFESLVTRLRKTKAINLRTKVAVKNESDDLLDKFRAYHARRGTAATLAELRRSYDSLFLKLHSLLRDADPLLDRDIDRSRAAIWEVLADPRKFGASELVAGG